MKKTKRVQKFKKAWVKHTSEHLKALGQEKDSVNHPSHYASGKVEVIEAIEDWNLGFHLGNAVKYVARAGKKNPDKYVEDLEKAIWYVRREIANAQGLKVRPNDMPQERYKK